MKKLLGNRAVLALLCVAGASVFLAVYSNLIFGSSGQSGESGAVSSQSSVSEDKDMSDVSEDEDESDRSEEEEESSAPEDGDESAVSEVAPESSAHDVSSGGSVSEPDPSENDNSGAAESTVSKADNTASKAEEAASKAEDPVSRTVYITPTGKRYHYRESCAGKNARETTLDQAVAKGLTPCKKCTNG